MTIQKQVLMFLEAADGDPHKALVLAVKTLAVSGHCISAGFLRVSPYDHILPIEKEPEPLDA